MTQGCTPDGKFNSDFVPVPSNAAAASPAGEKSVRVTMKHVLISVSHDDGEESKEGEEGQKGRRRTAEEGEESEEGKESGSELNKTNP
jgi:hypothetical protein